LPIALHIEEVVARFPSFRVALVVAEGLTIAPQRPPALEAYVAETEAMARASLGEGELATVPEVRAWRDAYKAFGVKKTSYRSSVERLLKNLQRGQGLPRVNALVDAYNVVSARFRMPVGADDLDDLMMPLEFRYARERDSFEALGGDGQNDPPKPGEVVYADAANCLCRRWNWYQDARSAIDLHTRRAVLTVQALAEEPRVEDAAAILAGLLTVHCGASVRWAVADQNAPVATLSRS
jgi:DNA/RNA-binding domain of Phe-tRNA-synthetase-like protein